MGDQRLILHSFTEAFSKRLTYALSPSNIAEYPADTQCCDNVDVRSRRQATSTQHCSNVGVTTLKLQRYSKFASTFDNSFSSQYTLDVILKTLLLQRWNQDVKFTMSSQRRHYDIKFLTHIRWSRYNVEINSFKHIVISITLKSRRESHNGFSTSILVLASTLYQLCISRVLPQIYKKIHLSDTQGWYSVIKFRPMFLSDTRNFPKVAFESLRKMSSDTLEFYFLKLSKGTAIL